MTSPTAWLTLIVFLLQSVPASPIRLGAGAQQLSESDITAIGKLMPDNKKPWLFSGDLGAMLIPTLYACLPATTQTSELRRGTMITLRWSAAASGSKVWTVYEANGAYAQVVEAGKDFNSFSGDMDFQRPFPVTGTFSDEELTSLVAFIRTSPDRVQGSWPIFTLRGGANSATVVLVGAFNPGPLQEVTLVRQGSTWKVTGTRNFDA